MEATSPINLFQEHTLSDTALHSKPFKTTPSLVASDGLRELIAAMPIVIFAKALKAALQRPAQVQASQSN